MNLHQNSYRLCVQDPQRKYEKLMNMRRERFGMRLNTFRNMSTLEVQEGANELTEMYRKMDDSFKPFYLKDHNIKDCFLVFLHIFQFLDLKDLLRVSSVSQLWNFVASHHSLWKTVRLEGIKLLDWGGLRRALLKHKTSCLAIILDDSEDQRALWKDICKAVKNVKSLTKVLLDRALPEALPMLSRALPHLTTLDSLHTQPGELNLAPIANLSALRELQVFGCSNGLLLSNIRSLKEMVNLKFLAISRVCCLAGVERYLPVSLIWLNLSPWSTISINMSYKTLPSLTNLWRLRLEHSNGCDKHTLALFEAISMMPNLYELELAKFPVKQGFDTLLGRCTNISNFHFLMHLVTADSATMNHLVLCGVSKLRNSLKSFVWELPWDLEYTDDRSYDLDVVPIIDKENGGVSFLAPDHLWMITKNLLPHTEVCILNVPFTYAAMNAKVSTTET